MDNSKVRGERRRLVEFPDPRRGTIDGMVAVGGALSIETLMEAYRRGIFPWPIQGLPFLPWFCPDERGILEFAELHIPRSLARERKKARYRFSIDQAFEEVIRACAVVSRKGENGTWITPRMLRAYCALHEAGFAHSIEVWEGEKLVGGLYGVDAGGAFTGESMFHLRPNTSKLALLYLIDYLQTRGLDWIDIQVMTPHMAALGAKLIPRLDFLDKLEATQGRGLTLFPPFSSGINEV